MCSREGLLDLENEEFVLFYLLSGQGPASSLSTGEKLQMLTLGPIYFRPHNHWTTREVPEQFLILI